MGSLIWYKFQFMVELLVIEAMFAYKLKRRDKFILRLLASLVVIFAVVSVFPVQYNALYGSLMFLLFFGMTIGAIAFCFRESIWNILFCGLAAYTVQHIAYLIYTIIVNAFTSVDAGNMYQGESVTFDPTTAFIVVAVYFACYIMVYVEAYFILIKMMPKNSDLQLGRSTMIVASLLVVVVDIVLNMFTVYNDNANELSVFLEQVYNLIICFMALQMLFQKLQQKKILEEKDIIYRILQQERQQFKHLKDNMNFINVKMHDLKHQLRTIRHSEQIDLQKLKSIEKTFAIYQTVASTGNETLDIVLTDKLLRCEQNGIDLICFADGRCISFMKEEDVFSLFGNALDNAIAAVEQLPEAEREIKLRIKDVGSLVIISVENKFVGELRMEEGIPVTTKKDTRYHGYGVLSMQMIVDKYNGKLSIDAKDNNFALNIIFNVDN